MQRTTISPVASKTTELRPSSEMEEQLRDPSLWEPLEGVVGGVSIIAFPAESDTTLEQQERLLQPPFSQWPRKSCC
jgi:hypothetical protein